MEVEIIKADNVFDGDTLVNKSKRLRVAAYCRVSTDDEDQIKSYNSMVRHYTDLINGTKEWIMAGVYADKAITGTKDNREEFQRLVSDCMDGKIDLVIAKSIPRFARNTLDTLKYVRMFKEKGIAVYFEVEKINTLKDGEFLITILSSVAQQEVENTSAYVKKGLKMKMARGELVGFQGCLGYDYDVATKTISVNKEQAEDVKYIFNRYVAGAGATVIARELNEMGKTTIRGNKWNISGIMGIIKNEKYTGDLMLGKTYTVDPISKRRLDNRGEEDKYFIKNHHEPIISREIYDKAQEIRKRRNGNRIKLDENNPGPREKFSRQFAFSCMIECGYCGKTVSRRTWHSSTSHSKTIWQCSNSTKNGKRACPDSKGITEDVIESAFLESYRLLQDENQDILNDFIKNAKSVMEEEDTEKQIKNTHQQIRKVRNQRKVLLDKYLEGGIAEDLYKEKDNEFQMKLSKLENKIQHLSKEDAKFEDKKKRMEEFRKILETNKAYDTFNRTLFESVVEKVILGGYDEDGNKDPYKITFIYKTGFKDDLYHSKERFTKESGKDKLVKACSNAKDAVKDACSNAIDHTCGDGCLVVPTKTG